jgi:sugar phosphate permease
MLDRYSPRRILLVGVIGMSIGLACFSFITTLGQMIAVYVVLALSLSLCGLVANMLVLSRWFGRLRGRATGILLMASSLGGAVFPLVLGATLDAQGWRGALLIFAGIAAVMTIPPLLFVIRDKPSDVGVAIDGEKTAVQPEASKSSRVGTTLREAVRHKEFFLIAFSTAAVWFAIISMIQHQSIYLARDIGVDRGLLPKMFSVFFLCSVVGKLVFGWMSDHFDKCNTMAASVATLILGLLILRNVGFAGNTSLFAYAIIAGIGFSGAFTSIQLLIARFYAGQSYGKILALLTLMDTLAGALGTRVVGQMRTELGSYVPTIDLMIGLCAIAIVCVLLVGRGVMYRITA